MSQPLHPNISAVLAELDQAREILREVVDAIPDSDRAKRPAAGVMDGYENGAMLEMCR